MTVKMNTRLTKTMYVLSSLVILVGLGCAETQPTATEESETTSQATQALGTASMPIMDEIPWEDQANAPTRPEGFEMKNRALFHLDAKTEEMAFKVQGNASFSIVGKLADRQGRRTLKLRTPDGIEDVAPAGWITPPASAMNVRGEMMVCYNVLVGKTSRLTEGMMPDPTQGVHAYCRLRKKDGWERAQRVGSMDRIASWVRTVTALPDSSFRLEYQADDGWLYDPDPRHPVLAQTLLDGTVVKSRFIRPTLDPLQ